MTYIKDISKYVSNNDYDFRKYLDYNMNKMVQDSIRRSENTFPMQEFISEHNLNVSLETGSNNNTQTNGNNEKTTNSNQITHFISALPPIDRRRQDTRIRYSHEIFS